MARNALINLTWADGDYDFRLGWGELEQLQEACDAGPYFVLGRLNDGTWRIGDISNTIRLGLIGGGMKPIDALKKVRAYVEARPPMENLIHAQVVLSAGCVGAGDEAPGEDDAANQDNSLTTFQTES